MYTTFGRTVTVQTDAYMYIHILNVHVVWQHLWNTKYRQVVKSLKSLRLIHYINLYTFTFFWQLSDNILQCCLQVASFELIVCRPSTSNKWSCNPSNLLVSVGLKVVSTADLQTTPMTDRQEQVACHRVPALPSAQMLLSYWKLYARNIPQLNKGWHQFYKKNHSLIRGGFCMDSERAFCTTHATFVSLFWW